MNKKVYITAEKHQKLTCDAWQQIIGPQTVCNVIRYLSTERKANNMYVVTTASISNTIHELSSTSTNVLYVVNNGRIAEARRQVEPVDKENVVRITLEIFCG